jgi:hypothetical protein
MAQTVQILNELGAVNLMLNAIGESPINSIEDTGLADAVTARATLLNVSRQVQQKGWKWNTLKAYTLTPEAPLPGKIRLPANTLSVDATKEAGVSMTMDVYDNGGYLFDATNNTDLFSDSIKCDIVILKEFDKLPSPARDYIACRAAREYQQGTIGSAQLANFEGISEADALRTLNNMETRNSDANVNRSNRTMARMHRRRR